MSSWIDDVPALLDAWYPGEQGGLAIAETLFGTTNPSGKLPITFPKTIEQIPSWQRFGEPVVPYDEGVFIGYRYQDREGTTPLFPFGHGLSYTDFEYRDLETRVEGSGHDTSITVSLVVTNTGDRHGTEVVQLYLGDEESTIERPIKELKALARVSLEAQESRSVLFELTWEDLAFWHPMTRAWTVEPGAFRALVGSSSRDIRLEGTFDYGT